MLVLIAVANVAATGAGEWLGLLVRLLLIGPVIGFAIGGLGSWIIGKADGRLGIQREFQALFGMGLVLAAFAAATAAGGDGFLAAFAAGLAVPVLNHQLCDCFLDYGDTTSEIAMLVAFVMFEAVLSTALGDVPIGPAVVIAVLAIFVIRPTVLVGILARVRISGSARGLIAWFGPRGLNSLLLALLVVQAGVDGSSTILAIVGAVVIVSAVVHGTSATPLVSWYSRKVERETLAEERESTAAALFNRQDEPIPRITVAELQERLAEPHPPLVLDVRSRSAINRDPQLVPGSERVEPNPVRGPGIGPRTGR